MIGAAAGAAATAVGFVGTVIGPFVGVHVLWRHRFVRGRGFTGALVRLARLILSPRRLCRAAAPSATPAPASALSVGSGRRWNSGRRNGSLL